MKEESRYAQKAIAQQRIEERALAARNKEIIRKHKEEMRKKRDHDAVRYSSVFMFLKIFFSHIISFDLL